MHRRGRSKRIVAASAVALAAGMLLSDSGVRVAAEPNVALQDVDDSLAGPRSSVIAGEITGAAPAVSGDGRFVVFEGAPPVEAEGAPTDTRTTSVFLSDRETGETVELSPVPDGIRSGDTVLPAISGDGCVVAAITEMPLDIFRDDDRNARWDVYRAVLPHCGGSIGDWELVSTRSGTGGLSRDDVVLERPAIERGGTTVAYTHPADHYFEPRDVTAISIVDLAVPAGDPFRTRLATGLPPDLPDNQFVHSGMAQPALSEDGRFLAFRSSATSDQPVPTWSTGLVEGGPATSQVYAWDLQDLDPFTAVRLVSATASGAPASAGAADPDISRDGTVVAFTSADPTLVPDASYPVCSANCPTQVFVAERDLDGDALVDAPGQQRISLVSAAPVAGGSGLIAGLAPSMRPALAGNGQLVAFTTKATNLQLIEVPGIGSGPDGDVLLAHLRRGTIERLTVGPVDGVVPVVGVHANPVLSDTGRTVVFDTAAADQLTGEVLESQRDPDDPESIGSSGRRVVARSLPPLLSLPDADLGTTLVGVEGDEWYVAVINDGPSSFQPSEVTISNSEFTINEEKSTCLLGTAIPAGGDCTVALSYTPRRGGTSSATLRVAEAGFGAVAIESNISGAGGEPTLRIDPAGADLGVVTVGDRSVEFQFDVANIAAYVPTSLETFEISGAHADDFELTTNDCLDRPLNPRASCSVGITFQPTDAGRRTALVTLGTPTGQYTTMVLAGDGLFEPTVEIARTEVAVGEAFIVKGSGYEANSEVTIVFGDDPSDAVVASTDADGNVFVSMPVSSGVRGGDRPVVVQSTSGVAASSSVEIRDDERTLVGMPGFGLGG
ncbi:MAG: choice-of-anchor D domain-containing protein [Actinomycetota bacterium]